MGKVIDASGGQPTPLPEIIDIFRNHLRESVDSTDPAESTPPLGTDELREALAIVLRYPPQLIAITSGVRAAVPLLAPMMRNVVFETPTFEDLPTIAKALGCQTARRTWTELPQDGPQVIWVTHPGRNPDGASLSKEILEQMHRRQNMVVINEIYRWHSATLPATPVDNIVSVGSLAKIWGAAARIGWIRGEIVPSLPKALLRISSPPKFVQHAWATFLRTGGLDYLTGAAVAASESRRRFCELVGSEYLVPCNDGPSVLTRLPPFLAADDAVAYLEGLGVKATAGYHFGVDHDSLRLTFTGIPSSDAELVAEAYRSLFRP